MKFIELTRSDSTGRVLLNTNNIASICLGKKAVSGGGYADVTVIQETTSADNYWKVTETIDEVIALLRKQDVQEDNQASLKAEIAQLQADNRSLVEQMNAMAMKPNQAIIERHEYDHDNPETYPAKRGFYICESASGKIELFWSPLAQEWYITEVHDKVYNHFQINAYYTWVKAPKGVNHE